jgi:Domain of unknown function (DUF4167)
MRPGQKNRMRGGGRSNTGGGGRRGPNPLTRSYESNGPDVKVRGTPQHIAEKYVQLARDAHTSSDTVMAESYLQHAEHYYRIIAAAQNAQQVAYNQANGIPVSEADQLEDEDEFEVAGADRFTFRAPQNFNPQGGVNGQGGGFGQQPYVQGQPYNGDLAGAEQPPLPEGQPPLQDNGQPAYQPQPRGDRQQQFGNRRFDERNNRRFGRDNRGERNFGDRQGNDRPLGDRPQGERPPQPQRSEAIASLSDEQPGLPSFITAPVRGAGGDVGGSPAPEASEDGGLEAGFKPRRRRRGRPSAEAGAPEAGGEE